MPGHRARLAELILTGRWQTLDLSPLDFQRLLDHRPCSNAMSSETTPPLPRCASAARSWSTSSCCTACAIFCVPGESYLAVLDALHDAPIELTVCRQEGGAAMMAEAHGKLTGRPGVCFVTRGPGATNAAAGVHIAIRDSTPMVLFVGQIERGARGREAFQEVDYRAAFGPLAKWATRWMTRAACPKSWRAPSA